MDTEEKKIEEIVEAEDKPKEAAETPSLDEYKKMQAALKEANKEAAARRKKLEEYEAAEARRKEAEMTEAQKLEKRASEAEAEAVQTKEKMNLVLIRAEIKVKAVEMGFADVEDAFNLLDKSKIEISEDGNVNGVKEALDALAKNKPYLLKQKGDGVGTGRGDKKRTQPEVKPTYTLPRL